MINLTYKIYTLGCKVNQYDSGILKGKLNAAGWLVSENKASIAIINTCAVTKIAIHKCQRAINRAKKENPGAKIFLTGCWPKIYQINARQLGVVIIGSEKSWLKNLSPQIRLNTNKLKPELLVKAQKRSRYFIKIQDGCNRFCSYCVVPFARGKLKSRGVDDISKEIKAAVQAGYKEVVLTGIHLGLYGQKDNERLNRKRPKKKNQLLKVLKKLLKIPGLGRIRLSSIEINEIYPDLIKFIKASGSKHKKDGSAYACRHLHIPLQSGSDKILRLMERPYTAKFFENKIKKIRQQIPDCALTTDVIVGFPGETAEDFKDTLKLCHRLKFSKIHVFPYSDHIITKSNKLPDKVPLASIQKRVEKLTAVSDRLRWEYISKFKGQELEVIIKNSPEKKLIGKTEFYFDVIRDKSLKKALAGEIQVIQIKKTPLITEKTSS